MCFCLLNINFTVLTAVSEVIGVYGDAFTLTCTITGVTTAPNSVVWSNSASSSLSRDLNGTTYQTTMSISVCQPFLVSTTDLFGINYSHPQIHRSLKQFSIINPPLFRSLILMNKIRTPVPTTMVMWEVSRILMLILSVSYNQRITMP